MTFRAYDRNKMNVNVHSFGAFCLRSKVRPDFSFKGASDTLGVIGLGPAQPTPKSGKGPEFEEATMEPVSPRQVDIVKRAKDLGRVNVEALAVEFNVTPQTIRKDINVLCERGLLNRFHGGAILASGVANFAYDSRRRLATEEKRLIGLKAADLIPDNSSLIINIGTTTEQVAMALRGKRGLLVITNNINAVNIMRGFEEIEVIVAGGAVRHADAGIVGEAAVEFIRQFRVDYAIIGASAIDDDGTLLDYDYREVTVAKAIMECARQTILVADSMKYGRNAPVRIGHLSQLDGFVTDAPLPQKLSDICRENNVRVEIATQP
jgi:DeoR family glycerol-3-phosphate regulon repressor